MKRDDLAQRLSKISTMWTVLHEARGDAHKAAAARQLLMERYGGAVRRYLLAAMRDQAAMDDLAQEFALNLLRGDFHNVDPQKGRFRDYIKTVLFNLVSKYRKRQSRLPHQLTSDSPEPAAPDSSSDESDRAFVAEWRDELLARTWAALAQTQPTFSAVLRFRTAHPDMPSGELAETLSRDLGKPMTAASVRQTLHRARECFADLLLDEVAQSLEKPTLRAVEEELEELNLLTYCQAALERQAHGRRGSH